MRGRRLDIETWRQRLASSATADWLAVHVRPCDVRASNVEFTRAAAVCTREPTHYQRLVTGVMNFLWVIVPLQIYLYRDSAFSPTDSIQKT